MRPVTVRVRARQLDTGPDAVAAPPASPAEPAVAPALPPRRWKTRLRRTRSHIVIVGAVAAVSLLGAGAASVGLTVAQGRPMAVHVNGASVEFTADHPTVADALKAAHVVPHDGAMFAVLSHRRLDARAIPAQLYLDGHLARPRTPLKSGQHITVVDGHDSIEPVEHRDVPIRSTGFPAVENELWKPGKPGVQEADVGRVSGEAAPIRIVTQPEPAVREPGKVVGLTFDDGPDGRWTPQVLQILHDENVKATFCIVGYLGARRPDLVHAVADAGHAVCDHTMHHMIHLDAKPHSQMVDEVNQGADVLRDILGSDPLIYRPPGGSLSPEVIDVVHQRNDMRVLRWSVDPADYRTPPPDVIKNRILSKVAPGSVILMHDGGGDRSHTVAMLKGLIDALKAQGYSFSTPLG